MGNPSSNSKDCFREFIGQRVKGVLFDAMPPNPTSNAGNAGSKTLIFEDGRGLTISSTGTFWVESKKNIDMAIIYKSNELTNLTNDLKDVLKLAGEPVDDGSKQGMNARNIYD